MEETQQMKLYRVMVERTVTESREMIVYAASEACARDSAEDEAEEFGYEDGEYVLGDSDWWTDYENIEYNVDEVDDLELYRARIAERFAKNEVAA